MASNADRSAVLVRVARRAGSRLPEHVPGLTLADVPGLAITPSIFDPHSAWRWTITHLASGQAVLSGGGIFYLQQAESLMREIGGFADWTRDRLSLAKVPQLGARIRAALDALPDMEWPPVAAEPSIVDGLPHAEASHV